MRLTWRLCRSRPSLEKKFTNGGENCPRNQSCSQCVDGRSRFKLALRSAGEAALAPRRRLIRENLLGSCSSSSQRTRLRIFCLFLVAVQPVDRGDRAEQTILFPVNAGAEEQRVGWSSGPVVAEGERPQAVDDHDGVVWVLYEAHEFVRSEEHTSELQSRGHLVCRLLLEKKKEYNS